MVVDLPVSHAGTLGGANDGAVERTLRRNFECDAKKAHAATQAALAEGTEPMQLIAESMVPAMDEVGKLFEAEEYFVPELLLAGAR